MRIVRFIDSDGSPGWGRWVDDQHVARLRGSLFGDHSFEDIPQRIIRLLPPVDPPNVFAVGRNYREHAQEMKAARLPESPLIFLKATTSVIGPGDAIVLPDAAPQEVDFEAELAVIIGKTAKDVNEANALDYVFGYTCGNDVSARDCQRNDKQWVRGKSFDTFCPLGPTIVTRDEMSPDCLALRSILNGQTMQDANTADMIFPVPSLISFLSKQFTLLPGTIILTGTPAGVGAARTLPVFLREGDEISIQIDGIGTLTNPVVSVARAEPISS